MNPTRAAIAVFGAAGHTGRFVVQEALRRGLVVVAVGRDARKLDDSLPSGVEWRVADIADPSSLDRAFAGCSVVINCAGPFLDTAAPVGAAALRGGCHYLDVTAEQGSAQATLADLDAPAQAAGRVAIPAAAFYGGLADLLASSVAAPGPIDAITVAIGLDHWWPTAGTRRTGERNTAPRMVVKEGHLAPLVPSLQVPDWRFGGPLGRQAMVEIPFSEVITLAHHLPVHNIRSLLNRSALQDIRDAATPPPVAADGSGRSAQQFEMVVQVEQNGTARTTCVRGQDIYAVTAPIVIEVAQRLIDPAFQRSGALALAQAVDAVDVLQSLHDAAALQWWGADAAWRQPADACTGTA
ncbi:putative NAD(P)-binding protein [Acidovorax sp. 107]|uniref:NAD(P)H-binding protein n=1 Tax=Acidovorax sp. 107 TaxID=2135638 RepID=UPI000D38E8EF|nr:NAD(P)H-binding protein [Acidovorax sp. 107]PUA97331.1 putative NAD(P)-binding protein [Acidovorax sp. 107]